MAFCATIFPQKELKEDLMGTDQETGEAVAAPFQQVPSRWPGVALRRVGGVMGSKNNGVPPTVAFVSGLSAGFTSTALLHPLDLIKTRFQVDESASLKERLLKGVASKDESRVTARSIKQQLGIRGLYRGLTPALLGSSASWALYWLLYENVKRTVSVRRNGDPNGRLSTAEYLGSSMLAGCITTCCTNPIWLIKTRMELQVRDSSLVASFLLFFVFSFFWSS
jgi:hypothetical protein